MLDLLNELIAVADTHFDGHLTIMKFTDNWRVGFGTPHDRHDIDDMAAGKSLRRQRGPRWPRQGAAVEWFGGRIAASRCPARTHAQQY